MENLYIDSTSKTPEIDFKITGQLSIKGNSYPENVLEFYGAVISWLDAFLVINSDSISINVDLKYINTSSTKSILNIITKISSLAKSTVKVAWVYEIEDDDMYATGEDLQKMSNLKFDFIEKLN